MGDATDAVIYKVTVGEVAPIAQAAARIGRHRACIGACGLPRRPTTREPRRHAPLREPADGHDAGPRHSRPPAWPDRQSPAHPYLLPSNSELRVTQTPTLWRVVPNVSATWAWVWPDPTARPSMSSLVRPTCSLGNQHDTHHSVCRAISSMTMRPDLREVGAGRARGSRSYAWHPPRNKATPAGSPRSAPGWSRRGR